MSSAARGFKEEVVSAQLKGFGRHAGSQSPAQGAATIMLGAAMVAASGALSAISCKVLSVTSHAMLGFFYAGALSDISCKCCPFGTVLFVIANLCICHIAP